MKTIINTDAAPKAIGPYSQAVLVDGFLYTAGQIAIDPATGEMVEADIEKQTERVLENIRAILRAAGMDFNNVIKTTVFVTNMADFAKINEIYGRYFKDNPPARSLVEVKSLPKGALIEIEVVAHK
ncbi:MAG: Endoribonuclease L-PSP [Caldanaerobacter subterraneus]|jgi:2-iminobutanoate/2-iminopropanoate deaminase|uniref:Translation initiation inhibitor n=2 Tax=Caldanaerobacter subterraneus TaxID=911092 RepID=Q8R9K4_CALS4|nr:MULTISPECIES: RidA family protein [Caldanaerobacter]AAM24807.1 putative translation initiation inhibitor [Caldanaerobacter subterraneus subsp. tengcongensis MB4]KUK08200.1 MAG: Endoribonuclease L-PSP [Caldanaerobacter subterraneus]MCS3915624.1 2-iminobutanoate/2-iminopropanoate deaminase [Caldanaerobacter subterraneus subsp. tengcongensis MB4]MDI3519430.1 2-iminobutanoate/2-iminopropanoate deaminase [Caldanaerobacter sp.]MDK2793891.1 2-iminobutanoate/2-iminopropanoate deaminase [Caldanaerob